MIFKLFKSKPTLKELIPEGFIDIHSHILPGIDDGAENIEQSIELILKMKGLGFAKIIGTLTHTQDCMKIQMIQYQWLIKNLTIKKLKMLK